MHFQLDDTIGALATRAWRGRPRHHSRQRAGGGGVG